MTKDLLARLSTVVDTTGPLPADSLSDFDLIAGRTLTREYDPGETGKVLAGAVLRLLDEVRAHRLANPPRREALPHNYSIAVDFDGVLHQYTSPWIAGFEIADPPVEGAIDWLSHMTEYFNVYLWSTRCTQPGGLAAMHAWFLTHGMTDEVWSSLIPWVYPGKPIALVYLDDRGLRFDGRFPTKTDIHRARPWNRQKRKGEV